MRVSPPLLAVVQKLGPLSDKVVFVGGMIRGLLTTDPAAAPPRVTDDVDLIAPHVRSMTDYYAFGEELRARGFREDSREGAPICRWVVAGVTVDIMPVDPAALGFTNAWYATAEQYRATTPTSAGHVHHLDAPHFSATKLEAFVSRAGSDYYHHDLEDFVSLVDERAELLDELERAPQDLRAFVAERVAAFLHDSAFLDALPGHLQADEVAQQRLPALLRKLQRIATLAGPAKVPRVRAASPKAPASAVRAPEHRIYVSSTNLQWVEYDEPTRTLRIRFHSGGTYRYTNVPSNVHRGLLAAYSKGKYFNAWIKGRYRDTPVR